MRIESTDHLDHPFADVAAWHHRPGALVRLTPPGLATIDRPDQGGLEVGRRTTARLGPGVLPFGRPRWTLRQAALTEDDHALRFEDRQVTGPFRVWHHVHELRGDAAGTTTQDTIEAEAPFGGAAVDAAIADQVRRTLTFRSQQLRDDLGFHARYAAAPRLTVAIAGASGLIGTQLAAFLETGGHRVLRMVRGREAEEGEISWDPRRGVLDPADLEGVDAIVNLAGRSIATRMTPRTKQEILSSRVSSSELISRTIAGMADGPRHLVQASAIGYYGAQRPGELLTEDDPGGDDLLAHVCRAWESSTRRAAEAGVRTVHLRTGIVLSDGGGALLPQLPMFLLGIGGRLAARDAVCSWITLDDMVRAYAHALLTPDLAGPVNAVAPNPATARELASTLGRVLHRPSVVPVPAVGPALLLGREGARELVRADQRVSDATLRDSGFDAAHPQLEDALRHALRR